VTASIPSEYTRVLAADIGRLDSLGLVESDVLRIEQGSICLLLHTDDQSPAAVFWLSSTNHQDRYLGEWSAPPRGTAYGHGLFVRPDLRGQGFGHRMLQAGLAYAAEADFHRVRNAVDPSNRASVAVHQLAGFEPVAEVRGFRFGEHHALRLARKTSPT
jgi:RimJ/RimL family protein N-acetyltransferase